jgi:MEMO1 family protein
MEGVRQPAVAGLFYPSRARELAAAVDRLLAEANAMAASNAPQPKAIIAPHAGYVYSGPVAARAYATLAASRARIRRAVVIGPAHYVWFEGVAAPSSAAFQTPLGALPVDRPAIEALRSLAFVGITDLPHVREHSLEVQLPFLQQVLSEVEIVPLLVGDARPEHVAAVLALLWGGEETMIVVSSDLSHYHDTDTARRRDAATADAIERGDGSRLGPTTRAAFCRSPACWLRRAIADSRRGGSLCATQATLSDRRVGSLAMALGALSSLPTQPAGREERLLMARSPTMPDIADIVVVRAQAQDRAELSPGIWSMLVLAGERRPESHGGDEVQRDRDQHHDGQPNVHRQ